MSQQDYGALIRRQRERAGIATIDVAAKVRRDQSWVSRLESGDFKETPQPEILDAIESVVGVSVQEQLEALGYHIVRSDETKAPKWDADVMEIARAVAMMDQEQRDAVRRLAEILIQRMPRSG